MDTNRNNNAISFWLDEKQQDKLKKLWQLFHALNSKSNQTILSYLNKNPNSTCPEIYGDGTENENKTARGYQKLNNLGKLKFITISGFPNHYSLNIDTLIDFDESIRLHFFSANLETENSRQATPGTYILDATIINNLYSAISCLKTPKQRLILKYINWKKNCTGAQIANKNSIEQTTLDRNLRILAKSNLITRKSNTTKNLVNSINEEYTSTLCTFLKVISHSELEQHEPKKRPKKKKAIRLLNGKKNSNGLWEPYKKIG